jgi:hypothetical protein
VLQFMHTHLTVFSFALHHCRRFNLQAILALVARLRELSAEAESVRTAESDDILALVAHLRELSAEAESVRTERGLLQAEVSSRWSVRRACKFLSDHVRSKRAARRRTITSLEDVDRDIRRIVLECLEGDSPGLHALPVRPAEHSAPAAATDADAERRTAEVKVAEESSAELVPFGLIAREILPAVEHVIAKSDSS